LLRIRTACHRKRSCAVDGEDGVYGTLGVPAAGNVPGSRAEGVGWTDKNGHLWLFGGSGLDSVGSLLRLNDLWEYQLKQSPTVALTSSANPVFAQNPITLTASVTAAGGTPTGTVTFLDGTISADGARRLTREKPFAWPSNCRHFGSNTLTN
jgi:hypothetical protein